MTTARRLVACFAIAAFALSLGVVAQEKKDKKDTKKTPTTKEIMKKVPGKEGLCAKCNAAAKGEKWEDAKKIGAELKAYGEALGKNTPKKGDKESWEKHAKGFSEVMTEIADAADKKDKEGVAAGAKKFGGMCADCHKAHK
ncbi:MAG: cytochrome c [Gemmataceae bacterium]|nr:cytochrome c [Planctomycetia bacterium]MBX3397466.1 cytochrome c [Gemmataceae bacterium]